MGIKKIARPINKAKNVFVEWLKKKGAENLDVWEGKDIANDWDYYRLVTAFIGEDMYMVTFEMWEGRVSIDYNDSENEYKKMSVEEFLSLIE